MAFLRAELRAPVDVEGLCHQIPDHLRLQVYAMSLAAIRLDNRMETIYLRDLAAGLRLSRSDIELVRARLGACTL